MMRKWYNTTATIKMTKYGSDGHRVVVTPDDGEQGELFGIQSRHWFMKPSSLLTDSASKFNGWFGPLCKALQPKPAGSALKPQKIIVSYLPYCQRSLHEAGIKTMAAAYCGQWYVHTSSVFFRHGRRRYDQMQLQRWCVCRRYIATGIQ